MTAQCYVCPAAPIAQCPGCLRWFCAQHFDAESAACVKCAAKEFVAALVAAARPEGGGDV